MIAVLIKGICFSLKQTGCSFAGHRGKLFEMLDVWSHVMYGVQDRGREKWGGNGTVPLSREEEGADFLQEFGLL